MTTAEMQIRDFEAGDEAAFRRLNEEWITRFFVVEPKDEYAFANPQKAILDGGGRIFLAVREGEAVGCVALIPIAPHEFEVAKMGVTESAQGGGVGRSLLQHAIVEARASGATRLYLETNSKLLPAIALYERLGFQRLPAVESPYARANVFMELSL